MRNTVALGPLVASGGCSASDMTHFLKLIGFGSMFGGMIVLVLVGVFVMYRFKRRE